MRWVNPGRNTHLAFAGSGGYLSVNELTFIEHG
jgi:hypothetical protein